MISGVTMRCLIEKDYCKQTKFEQYGDLVDQAILNLMRPLLTIKTHKAKLKMMKQEGHNILKKVIPKTKKQTKLRQLRTLHQKYYQTISQKV